MAFQEYIGDTVATGIILQTINSANAIIPGVTVKADLAGQIGGESIEFIYNTTPAVTDAAPGADFSISDTVGNKKARLTFARALQINEKVYNVATAAISAPIFLDKLARAAVRLSNQLSTKFITDLSALAQAKTFVYGTDIYNAIIDAQKTFATGTSVKIGGLSDTTFSNATNAIEANFVMVGPLGRSDLLQSEMFVKANTGSGEMPGMIGNIAGLDVVYNPVITSVFIMGQCEGIAYPFCLKTLRAVDSEMFSGFKIQGEVDYAKADEYAILPIDSFAMVYTEGEAPSA